MKHLILISLCFCAISIEADRRNPYGVRLTGVNCEFGKFCERSICKLKPINRTVTVMNIGCYLIKPQNNIKVKVEFFLKSSSNVYQPGSIRYVQDYCAMMRGETNVISQTFSTNYKILKETFQPCPVLGKHMFDNVPCDSSLLPSTLLATGDYRMDVRQYNGLNETIFNLKLYATVKNPFF